PSLEKERHAAVTAAACVVRTLVESRIEARVRKPLRCYLAQHSPPQLRRGAYFLGVRKRKPTWRLAIPVAAVKAFLKSSPSAGFSRGYVWACESSYLRTNG